MYNKSCERDANKLSLSRIPHFCVRPIIGEKLKRRIKLFISYASEDRRSIVKPLAKALSERYDVWYDKYSLVMGDSLREKIDEGLSNCDFGIVVLSHFFFAKKWPQMELDGLISRESSGRKVILPIWHKISKNEVEKYSPILADKLGINSSYPLKKIIAEIGKAIHRENKQQSGLSIEGNRSKKKLERGILDEALLPEARQVVITKLNIPELSKSAIDMLLYINTADKNNEEPYLEDLVSIFMRKHRHLSKEAVEDALCLLLELLSRNDLIKKYHDSLGYPFWKPTNKGKQILTETY